jgi:hypothetical protein
MYIISILFSNSIYKPKEGTILIFYIPYPISNYFKCISLKKPSFTAIDFNNNI